MRIYFDPDNHQQHDDDIENKSRMLLVTSSESLYHRANAMQCLLVLLPLSTSLPLALALFVCCVASGRLLSLEIVR